MQSENKISSEINLENELLLDALMTDVDVHSLITDDVVHSLTAADVVVCSQSIYTRPQLTDSLGAQHACLPVCTSTTTTATQPGHQPLLMTHDTQPPLPASFYSQPAPALTTVHQPDINVHQLATSVQQSVTDMHQLSATAGVQQQSAEVHTQPSVIQPACTQPSVTQLLYTQPSTTWLVYTQPTHPQPLTAWTAAALPLGTQPPQPSVPTQPPQPSVSAYTADVAVLSDTAQPTWMLPVGVHPAQSGRMHSLDVRPACTQPPLPQPLHMQMPGARPAYTQSAASQTHSTYTVGAQPVSQQGNSPL